MYRYNHHQLLNIPYLRSDHLSALYVADTLRTFANTALGIFVPIFIYRLTDGDLFVFSKNGPLIAVLGYFILLRLSLILSTISAAKLIVYIKSGFRRAMLLGNFLTAIHLMFLIFAERNLVFLIPSAVFGGVATPLYWMPYHLIFVEDGTRRKLGRQRSLMAILSRLANVAGPFLGGLVLTFLNFDFLAAGALLLIVFSSLPLFLPPHHEKHFLPPTKSLFSQIFSKKLRNPLVAFVGAGIENDVQGIIWPLFLFAIVGSYLTVGTISSSVLLISVVTLMLVGKWADSKNRAAVLRWGGLANSLIWGLKIFVRTPFQAFATDLGARMAKNFLWIPFDVFTYRRAGADPLGFLIVREWVLNLGRLLGLILILIMVLLGINWIVAFALGAVGSLLALRMVA